MSDTQPNPAEPTENQPGKTVAAPPPQEPIVVNDPTDDEEEEPAAEPAEDLPGGGQQ